jgi:RNA polymerase sigma factor (TIGR02999 family)
MGNDASNSAAATGGDVTRILDAAQKGDPKAAGQLLPLVYDELRKLAAAKMAQERPNQTLQPTALVHEAWLRLVGQDNQRWDGRAHFFGAAAEAMRRILIDRARRRTAARHGGGEAPLAIDQIEIAAPGQEDDWLELSDALERLEAVDKQKAEFIKLRYFVGLSLEEAADVLGVSVPTASRWWSYSRAWLAQEIEAQRKT